MLQYKNKPCEILSNFDCFVVIKQDGKIFAAATKDVKNVEEKPKSKRKAKAK